MKKLILFITVFTLSVGLFNLQNVGAETTSVINWDSEDTGLIFGQATIPADVTSMTLKLKTGGIAEDWLVLENDDYEFGMIFLTDTYQVVTTLFDELDPATLGNDKYIIYPDGFTNTPEYTEYYINFEAYEINQDPTGDTATSLYFSFPVDGAIDSTTFNTLFDEMEDDSILTFSSDSLGYGEIALAMEAGVAVESSSYTQDVYISTYISIPPDTTNVDLYLGPLGIVFSSTAGTVPMTVYYYDDEKNLVNSEELTSINQEASQFYPDSEDQTIYKVPYEYFNYNVTNEVSYIRVEFSNYNDIYALARGLNTYASQCTYYIDHEAIKVNWNVDGEVSNTYYLSLGTITQYIGTPPTVEGKTFQYWIDQNGNTFEKQAITTDMLSNNIANLYGVYIDTPTTINGSLDSPEVGEGNIAILLDDLGFNDGAERVIVFALVLIIVTIALLAKRVPMFNILVVDGVIVAFFVTLGLLPTFVTIIISIVLIFLAYRYFMGGGGSSE